MVLITLTVCIFFVGLGYLLVALVKNISNTLNGSSSPFVLPYNAVFMYDVQKSPAFEMTFLFHAYMSYLSPILTVSW